MSGVQILTLDFQKICDGLKGAEGPVFDKNGRFFMVAPEVEDADGHAAGEVLLVNLENSAVSKWCCPTVDAIGGIPAGCQVQKQKTEPVM